MFLRIMINLVALFMLFGCGFMFDGRRGGSSSNSKVSNEIKSFALGLSKGNDVNSVLKKSINISKESNSLSKTNLYQKETVESCESGGTISLITDDNNTSILKVIANDCIEDGIKINYSASVRIEEIDNDLNKTTIFLNQDAIFEDLETAMRTTFFKDSTMIIDELSPNEEIITETIKYSTSTGEIYESINLISYEQYGENSSSLYEVSGQVVYNGITYSVDEAYDSSKTPMLSVYKDDEEYVVSGIFKYYNEQNQHITIEIVGKDTMKISVDINNDGKDDAIETISI